MIIKNSCLALQTYQLEYRVFDGFESKRTTIEITLQAQNLFPPKFEPLIYNVDHVPETIDSSNLPYRLTTVSISIQQITKSTLSKGLIELYFIETRLHNLPLIMCIP